VPSFLAIALFLGGAAVLVRAGVAAHRLLRMSRQRKADRRSARDVKAFVQGRMRNGASSSRELDAARTVGATRIPTSAQNEHTGPGRITQ
jgi:hypothetical protein